MPLNHQTKISTPQHQRRREGNEADPRANHAQDQGLETEDVGDPILETVTGAEGPILGPHHAEGDPIPGLSNFIPSTPHDMWSSDRFGPTNVASLWGLHGLYECGSVKTLLETMPTGY